MIKILPEAALASSTYSYLLGTSDLKHANYAATSSSASLNEAVADAERMLATLSTSGLREAGATLAFQCSQQLSFCWVGIQRAYVVQVQREFWYTTLGVKER